MFSRILFFNFRKQLAAYNRWYVIGQDLDKNSLRVFPLDRILALEVVKAGKFKALKVDSDTLFEHRFGIILPHEEQQIEEVILSYSAFQGKYIKSLPLHHTQEIVVDNEEELLVKPICMSRMIL